MEEPDQTCSVRDCVDALRRSSSSDVVAILCGLATFPLGFLAFRMPGSSLPPGLVPSVSLLVLSVLAALVSSARATSAKVPPHLLLPSGTRWGARIGTLVVLIGGGVFLLATTGRQVTNAIPLNPIAWEEISRASRTAVFFTLLPTIAVGSSAAVAGLSYFRWVPPPRQNVEIVANRRILTSRALPWAASLLFLTSLLSTAVPGYLAKRRSPDEGSRQASESSFLPYLPPAELSTAGAERWTVTGSRTLPGLSKGLPASHSSDGRFLAFGGRSGGLIIYDLRNGEVAQTFTTPALMGVAWSPDGQRIFCLGNDASTCVCDRTTGSVTAFRVRGRLALGNPRWGSDDQIRIMGPSGQIGTIDLGRLRARAFQFAESDQGEALRLDCLAETQSCQISIRPLVRQLAPPTDTADGDWRFDVIATLCVVDKASRRSYPLLERELQPGTAVLASPDSSMLTIVTDAGAATYYMGLTDSPKPVTFGAKLASLPRHAEGSRLAGLASSGRIGVFICAPLINPLNGKVIGPDTTQVRALAFCSGWETEHEQLTVVERYSPFRPGDVAALPHYWVAGHPTLLTGGDLAEWWCEASGVAVDPAKSIEPSLPWQSADLVAAASGVEFAGWQNARRPDSHSPTANARALADGPPKKPAEPTFPPKSPQSAQAASPDSKVDPTNAIWRFVAAHHAKVGQGDLEGFVGDYADVVDFNDKGRVERDFIRRDQAAYLPKYDNISETVVGAVRSVPQEGGWQVSYTMRSYAISKRDGKEHDRNVRITLNLRARAGGGYEIVRERAVAN